MNLYIMRHGPAVDVGERGVARDADRMLSAQGRRQTRAAAMGLRKLGCRPRCIASSPLVRARETAAIARAALAVRKAVEMADVLAPGNGPDEAVAWLGKRSDESLMIVGHSPALEYLAATLLAGTLQARILLKKSAVLCLSFENRIEAGKGQAEWLAQPKLLRLAGKA
jgi:phosphohistidine phosphatase